MNGIQEVSGSIPLISTTYSFISSLSFIWGYSSAGSPVEAVTHPSQNLINVLSHIWGYSSAGRALEWHSRGQRFDPAYLHHLKGKNFSSLLKGSEVLFLCGDFYDVQSQAELRKINVEINVQLIAPIDLHPADQAVNDHFLCLQAGRVV